MTSATDAGGDLPDTVVVGCVVRALSHAHFDVPRLTIPGLSDVPETTSTFDVPVRFEPSSPGKRP